MVRNLTLPFLSVAVALACLPLASGATLTGIVTDALGKPLEDARIEHIGKMVVVSPTELAIKPSPGEVRTNADGHFQVVTDVPAIIVRKPGYQSQRIRLSGDAQVKVELQQIKSTSRCKLSATPRFKTKESNDIDHTANWIYIVTKDGPKGIISGNGPMYSFGAPHDKDVWTSVEYEEIMYEVRLAILPMESTGVIGASSEHQRSTTTKIKRRRNNSIA
jgi:hypothetical protein